MHSGSGIGPKPVQRQEDDELGGAGIGGFAGGIFIPQQLHFAAGGGYSRTGLGIGRILFPDGNIIQRKDFAGDPGRQRIGGKPVCDQTHIPNDFQQGLAGPGLDISIVNDQVHTFASYAFPGRKTKRLTAQLIKTGSQPFTVVRRNACPYCRHIPLWPAATADICTFTVYHFSSGNATILFICTQLGFVCILFNIL